MSRLRPLRFALLLCATVWLVVACRGEEPVPFARDEQVQISCSDTCAVHGQCGTLGDGRRAVLANEGGPAVTLHNRFFIEDTIVTVVESNPRELIAASNGQPLIGIVTPFPHLFYLVSGENKTAWVSEWCLARP